MNFCCEYHMNITISVVIMMVQIQSQKDLNFPSLHSINVTLVEQSVGHEGRDRRIPCRMYNFRL